MRVRLPAPCRVASGNPHPIARDFDPEGWSHSMTDTSSPDTPDEQLAATAVRDGQGPAGRAAASQLLGRYQRRVYLWCRRYVRDPERAIDLAQEVLLSAFRALPSFEGRSRFSSWLFAIARNRCLNAMASPGLLCDPDVELDGLPASEPPPDEELATLEDEESVRRLLLEHLDPEEREALWLRCFERIPVDEIGRVMRLENASGARGLLQRARRKLRAALAQRVSETHS